MTSKKGSDCLSDVALEDQVAEILKEFSDHREQIAEIVALIKSREDTLQAERIKQRTNLEDVLVMPEKREQYADRVNPKEGPLEFLRRVWPESRSQKLYQFQLRQLDNKLFVAVRNWAQRNGEDVSEILPPKSVYIDNIASEHPDVAEVASRLYASFSRRRKNR